MLRRSSWALNRDGPQIELGACPENAHGRISLRFGSHQFLMGLISGVKQGGWGQETSTAKRAGLGRFRGKAKEILNRTD